MSEVAQTNLQLYRMLLERGWDEESLMAVRRAYEFATSLFTAQFRPSGKPFICHLVGSAAVAATQSDQLDVVVATLMHAAYDYGDWGDGLAGPTRSRRAALRAVVGEGAERLVLRYTELGWSEEVVDELLARHQEMPEVDRVVVLMRLANEVDEMVDLGLRLSPKGDQPHHQGGAIDAMATLGRAVGLEPLARRLERSFDDNRSATVPPSLKTDVDVSGTVLPRSAVAKRRAGARVRHIAARLRQVGLRIRARRLAPGSARAE